MITDRDDGKDESLELEIDFNPATSIVASALMLLITTLYGVQFRYDAMNILNMLEIETPALSEMILSLPWVFSAVIVALMPIILSLSFKRDLNTLPIIAFVIMCVITTVGIFYPLIIIVERVNA